MRVVGSTAAVSNRWLWPRLSLFAAAWLLALVILAPGAGAPRLGGEGIEVRSNVWQSRFPQGIQFTLFAASGAEINNVRLRYRVLPDGPLVLGRPQCTSGSSINCSLLIGETRESYMVPGAEVVHAWEIDDAGGNKLTTAEATAVYEDTRFRWESIAEGNVRVLFYFGDDRSNQAALRTARETIDRFSALLGTRVDHTVKVWVYNTVRDLQPAVASRRAQGGNTSVRTLGEVGASDTALVSRETDFLNIIRHELAHSVTRAATRNHIAEIPVWVNEGISTYAQRELLPDEAGALDLAIRRNRLLPISSLTASSRGGADVVSLFYAQSGSLIRFLVETQGEARFRDFIQALGRDTLDGALRQVYGFDQLGLENAWRRAVGLPPVDAVAAAPAQTGPQTEPTIVPFGAQQPPAAATPARDRPSTGQPSVQAGEDGGGSSLPIVAGAVIAVVVVAGGAAFYLRKRARSQA